jgi:hypothetical protein
VIGGGSTCSTHVCVQMATLLSTQCHLGDHISVKSFQRNVTDEQTRSYCPANLRTLPLTARSELRAVRLCIAVHCCALLCITAHHCTQPRHITVSRMLPRYCTATMAFTSTGNTSVDPVSYPGIFSGPFQQVQLIESSEKGDLRAVAP